MNCLITISWNALEADHIITCKTWVMIRSFRKPQEQCDKVRPIQKSQEQSTNVNLRCLA